MLFAILNNSTMVNDTDLTIMCAAIQLQLTNQVAPLWNQTPGTVRFFNNITSVPADAWIIYIIDTDTQAEGALGFHEETNVGRPDGYIMCAPILQNGGAVLQYTPSNPDQYTVSATLDHEILECFIDPYANTYCDNGEQSFALEICDAVEQTSYGIVVNNVNVALSDFVLPNYFNPSIKDVQFNYLNTVKNPFEILPGGYSIVRDINSGTERQVFGEKVPAWRKEVLSSKLGKSNRRIK